MPKIFIQLLLKFPKRSKQKLLLDKSRSFFKRYVFGMNFHLLDVRLNEV